MNRVIIEKPLSIEELKSLVPRLKKSNKEFEDLFKEIERNPEKIELLSCAEVELCKFYELTFSQHQLLASSPLEIENEIPDVLSSENRVDGADTSNRVKATECVVSHLGASRPAAYLGLIARTERHQPTGASGTGWLVMYGNGATLCPFGR